MTSDIPLPHPGVILREEFLEPMGLSVYALAKSIHVTRSRINDNCATAAKALPPISRFASAALFGVDPAMVHEHAGEIRSARAREAAGERSRGNRAAHRGVNSGCAPVLCWRCGR